MPSGTFLNSDDLPTQLEDKRCCSCAGSAKCCRSYFIHYLSQSSTARTIFDGADHLCIFLHNPSRDQVTVMIRFRIYLLGGTIGFSRQKLQHPLTKTQEWLECVLSSSWLSLGQIYITFKLVL